MNSRSTPFLQRPFVLRLGATRHLTLPAETVLLGLLLIAGALLRFVDLDRWSLWTDELYTLRLVGDLSILAEGVPDDQHPPLYYILLHYLTRLSDREFWLRLPSAVAGFLAIPLMWRIGVTAGRRDCGLLAAALLAVSPLHIWYSREARMYGLASLFWIASLFFYVRVLRRDNRMDAVGLVTATLAGLFTAYPTLALWVLELSFFPLLRHLWLVKRRSTIRWLAAQAAIATVFLAWWPYFRQQLGRQGIFQWSLPGLPVAATLAQTIYLALAAGLLVILVGVALWLLVRQRPGLLAWAQRRATAVAMALVIALIGAIILGGMPLGLSIRRQLLVFWPPFLLSGAWGLAHLRQGWLTTAVLGLSLLLALTTVLGPPLEDWRGAASYLAVEASGEEMILVAPDWATMGFDYYYDGPAPYRGANRHDPGRFGETQLVTGDTIWLVVIDHPTFDRQTMPIDSWLQQHAALISKAKLPRNLTITHHQIK